MKNPLSPAEETALRSLGGIVIIAVLGWLSIQANIAPIIGISGASLVAIIANALDSALSPNGTVLAGSVGSPRQ